MPDQASSAPRRLVLGWTALLWAARKRPASPAGRRSWTPAVGLAGNQANGLHKAA